jgi:sigma-B regulation protein RsbU (phosphoserine phosphatase)
MNMALALATLAPGRARISAGGMPQVLHYKADDGTVTEVLMHAPPAGQLARAAYREESLALAKGDGLLFFTDGLPELQSEAGDLFGYDRVRDVFRDAARAGAQGAVDALFAAADAFRGTRPPDDDITLVAVAVS